MTSHTQVGVARRTRPSPSGARGDDDASQAESVIVDGLDETDEVPDLPPSEAPATSDATRAILLASARRRLVPIRRTFVQLPRNGAREAGRVGPLGRLVEERQHVALDLILLLLALQPIISERDPLPGGTWAHPGEDRDAVGYFSLPRRYWTDGWHERLRLPGKAMLLILLAETNTPGSPTFTLPAARIAQLSGFATSTVKRGLDELREHGLLDERWQRVPAPRSATGWTYKVHYWLNSPFSTKYREAARKADGAEIAAKTKAIAESKSGKQT